MIGACRPKEWDSERTDGERGGTLSFDEEDVAAGLNSAYELLLGVVHKGNPAERAAGDLARAGVAKALIDGALERYRELAKGVKSLRYSGGLESGLGEAWYTGPREGDINWPSLEQTLAQEGFPRPALQSLDDVSTRIVGNLPPVWRAQFSGRGLVLGYVQSGKTSNYTAVIAKAADAGYRLFIVLSGIHNNLRRQTQARLDRQLVVPQKGLWIQLTTEEKDFGDPGNADALLTLTTRKVLCVVKKNKTRLENLLRWLGSANPSAMARCPILVIDDEADQASINTGDPEDRTRINKLLLQLLSQERAAYIGYTATPYANLFIDPTFEQDLYPKDFIIDLPHPEGYFGPERIFGRERLTADDEEADFDGMDVVRIVSEDEAKLLRPPRKKELRKVFEPELTPSLADAIRYFFLATAARRARGQTKAHSSMLIHTTMYTDIHEAFRDTVRGEILSIRKRLEASTEKSHLLNLWTREMKLVAGATSEKAVDFEDVYKLLPDVLNEASVVVDNYRSVERLDFSTGPQTVLVIGGNTLSRGLTLEGLIVSFFLRTASAYDTLLQMGRWFGYRAGYEDLPRLWMTSELQKDFMFLSTVEEEIRLDVQRYEVEDRTPLELATRIRTHPKLAITSALKMQSAVPAKVSYSDRRLQTILFRHRDSAWLIQNQVAARELLIQAQASSEVKYVGASKLLIEDVEVAPILEMLGSYQFHQESRDLNSSLISAYIQRQNELGDLLTWNVIVMSRADMKRGEIDLGLGHPIGLMNRARMANSPKDRANIKSLMSKPDRVSDLGIPESEIQKMNDEELQAQRSKTKPGVGLILLYPIDRNSEPLHASDGRQQRENLEAAEDVIGLGLVFPKVRQKETELEYMSVDLSSLAREEEEFDLEASDSEPSLNEVED